MYLNWKRKDFKSDIDFILFHQQDSTPEWWRKRLFEAYPALNYEYSKSLPETERFEYITEQMKIEESKRQNVIENSIKVFAEFWNTQIANKLNNAYTSAFDNDCSTILNDMNAEIGLNPICPRTLSNHSFNIYHYFDSKTAITMALHEITHFVWFHFWQQYFQDNSTEYDFPHLKWLLSEIVVETIIRNSQINDLTEQPKYIAYSYFYDIQINQQNIFEIMKNLYLERTNIYDFMKKSFHWIQNNETMLRQQIELAENKKIL